jgi:cytidine deaminase
MKIKIDKTALTQAAAKARAKAYAPYSKYKVGAAALGASGKIYTGANIENASYGLTICAERSAIFAAVSAGEKQLLAIAIAVGAKKPGEDGSPCGACRQVMAEFMALSAPVYVANISAAKTKITQRALKDYLPYAFTPKTLSKNA